MRFATLFAVLMILAGCAQVREQFREHPVRTVVLVGGAVAIGALAARDNDEEPRPLIVVAPPNCARLSCK